MIADISNSLKFDVKTKLKGHKKNIDRLTENNKSQKSSRTKIKMHGYPGSAQSSSEQLNSELQKFLFLFDFLQLGCATTMLKSTMVRRSRTVRLESSADI